jgi:hypothetical protein
MSLQEKLLIVLWALVGLITCWAAFRDDSRRGLRRRWQQHRAWRDLEARRTQSMIPQDERSKRVLP